MHFRSLRRAAHAALLSLLALAGCPSPAQPPEPTPPTCAGTTCDGVCVDPRTDLENCGECGHACASGQRCAAGACEVSCPGTQAVCGEVCATLSTDRANCGACGAACGPGTRCADGACQPACRPVPLADDATCDGIDDDCDGSVDEDYAPRATTCGVGACASVGQTRCAAARETDDCAAGAPSAADATCDGVDDDCDGSVDEEYAPTATTCGAAECAAVGELQCLDGALTDTCAVTPFCAWRAALPTEPYAALADIIAEDPCTLATFDREKCDYYQAQLDSLLAHNTQPPGCGEASWVTDPAGLGAAQLALPAAERHLLFVDACNPRCTDGAAAEAFAAWDPAAQAVRRARATDPATPACSIAGVSATAVRTGDRVLIRRGLVQHFSVDTGADSYVWSQLLFGIYGATPAQEIANFSVEAYPGDTGLVTLQFARTLVGRTSTGRSLMVERDTTDPEYPQLSNGVGNAYALYAYGIRNLAIRGVRFAGAYHHDGSRARVPSWVPQGWYYGLAAQLYVHDLDLEDSEFVYSEAFERAIPHMACDSTAGPTACDPIVLDNGVSIGRCDPNVPSRFTTPCAAGPGVATVTLRASVPGTLTLRHSKVIGARAIPALTESSYYTSRGDLAGVTQDAFGIDVPPSQMEIVDSYLADAGHFLVALWPNAWVHDSVFRNRLHSSLALNGDAIVEGNLFYDSGRAAPWNPANVFQGTADRSRIDGNKMYVSGPGMGAFGLYTAVDATISHNVYFDDSGAGGSFVALAAAAGTGMINLEVTGNLVFGVNGYKGPDVGAIVSLIDFSGEATYTPPTPPTYLTYSRFAEKNVRFADNRVIVTATESKLVGLKVFRGSDGAYQSIESVRCSPTSGSPASAPGLSFERLEEATTPELRALFFDPRVDADWSLLESRIPVVSSPLHMAAVYERY